MYISLQCPDAKAHFSLLSASEKRLALSSPLTLPLRSKHIPQINNIADRTMRTHGPCSQPHDRVMYPDTWSASLTLTSARPARAWKHVNIPAHKDISTHDGACPSIKWEGPSGPETL